MITLEELAKEIGGKIWHNRIYVFDVGYNTKKTRCRAYIYALNRSFHAACYIKCPSQPPKWIDKEQRKIEKQLMERVNAACKRIKQKDYEHSK